MTTPFPIGSELRVNREPTDLEREDTGWRKFETGTVFTLEDYISTEESDDGIAYFIGSTPALGSIAIVPQDAVELVADPEPHPKRELPSARDIFAAIDLFDGSEELRINDCNTIESDAQLSLKLFGTTEAGLHFSFELHFDNIQKEVQ